MANLYRHLPSVDAALAALLEDPELALLPRLLLKDLVNDTFEALREDIREGSIEDPAGLKLDVLLPGLRVAVRSGARPHFRRVLNATGVVIHTNLGRSILAPQAMEAVSDACAHYSNLEFALETGERGSRYSHVEPLLCRLTGAEAALVVNNNAAAVMLILDTMAKGREVVVSRGQLVEIGGSFRIPDVMEKSGAILREVGATNRTHLHDYEDAINENTGALMKVHCSNFRVIGFTKEVSASELAALGQKHDLPVIEDLGSGSLFDFGGGALDEPTVQQAVAAGLDVVSFSGDKVLGGPQAGIIVGTKRWIDKIKKNPMNRALRIDKMTLAALEATLRLYLDPLTARRSVPTLKMITATADELKVRARRLKNRLGRDLGDTATVDLVPGVSRVGGGSFPERDLPTTLVTVEPSTKMAADELKARLRDTTPPLIGRIEDDRFCLDPRTLEDKEFQLASAALQQVLNAE
ncbi:L-seryl-tRNA(Sec) selenium transferase [Desulfovibrio ferrophilus]|uniref:L-seryl-tRNA(Sec) selenium transferase n=1 Tax=Desulfovibrio ferrophilus TaxID=241368 RepID=A0A2Z6AYS6_9BACT|nr:L-seryl-tRNA(Sec) selenium transferase [Desulfovibrio ferrophilus]BBD08417.1 selenocysteine synthase [Desulfovibrio ferrophilus]